MQSFSVWFTATIFVIFAIVGYCFLAAIPTWLLWNYLVPSITKGALTEITFWQAFWLNFLTSILFNNTYVSTSK